MKKRRIFKLAVIMVAFIVGIYFVNAANDVLTYTVSTESGAHAIKQGTCSGTCSGFTGTLDFFCLQGSGVVQGIVGATASEMEITEDNFIIASTILNEVKKHNQENPTDQIEITENSRPFASSHYSLYSTIENALYSRTSSTEATKWYNTYNAYKNGFNPTISKLSTLTLSGDNYQTSATISDLGEYAQLNCTSSLGTANVSGTTVTVTVPKASVTASTTVNLTCTASYEYYMSQRFDGQQGTQDLAIKPKKYSDSKSLTASTSLTIKPKVIISKTDATGQNELPGATLSILGSDGKVLNKCVFDKTNHKITYSDGTDAVACTWTSEDVSYTFEGLPVGKYYLVEEIAPAGYEKSTEKILIEITESGAVKDKVVMKNSPKKVPVPDTLSTRSAILLTISMIDVALGIGLLLYIKKNKILN